MKVFLLNILFIVSTSFPLMNENVLSFVIQNKNCFKSIRQRKFVCKDIDNILEKNLNKYEDIKYVCDHAYYDSFTNNQFTQYVNYRLYKNKIYNCNISTPNRFGDKQLKDQCPTEYNKYCETNSNFYSFSAWLF